MRDFDSICNIPTDEQAQILQLYKIVKLLEKNQIYPKFMGNWDETVNYNEKFMIVSYNGNSYIKRHDGDCINLNPINNSVYWQVLALGIGDVDISKLINKFEGTDDIVVDLNESGNKIEFHLDEELKKELKYGYLSSGHGYNHYELGGTVYSLCFSTFANNSRISQFNVYVDGHSSMEFDYNIGHYVLKNEIVLQYGNVNRIVLEKVGTKYGNYSDYIILDINIPMPKETHDRNIFFIENARVQSAFGSADGVTQSAELTGILSSIFNSIEIISIGTIE